MRKNSKKEAKKKFKLLMQAISNQERQRWRKEKSKINSKSKQLKTIKKSKINKSSKLKSNNIQVKDS